MTFPDRKTVERLREQFPVGCRIVLDCMDDPYVSIPPGTQGTCRGVDDVGSVMAAWDCGSSLSIGQNQRLAIARAVLADAPIMLLDEVTSALDLETEERVLQNIAALPNKTCIISTHRPSVLSLCDHIYKIQDKHLLTVE